jgi:hypothetical protein
MVLLSEGAEMSNDKKRNQKNVILFPEPSPSGLRGRQSVRATFKLTQKAIEALSIVSVHLGIKQKSLFDYLMEDADSLSLIAREIESFKFGRLTRIQKTFVLSRKTLACLESTAQNFDAPRDALVEYSIQRLLPIIRKEREKHLRRKEILKNFRAYLEQGESLLTKSKRMLGSEDPVHDKLKAAFGILINAYHHMENYVERGKIIENF